MFVLLLCCYLTPRTACPCSTCSEWRPHTQSFASRPALLRRPASFAGYADPSITLAKEPWLNRLPAPKIAAHGVSVKRSSLSSFATLHEVLDDMTTTNGEEGIRSSSSGEIDPLDLPPPPDFLLDDTALSGASPNSLSVAAAVKTLTAIGHQPVSPVTLRRTQSMRVTGAAGLDRGSVRNMQAIFETGDPLASQRRVLELEQQRNGVSTMSTHKLKLQEFQEVEIRSKNSNERVVSGLLSQTEFVHTLNVTLAKQQELPQEQHATNLRRSRTINERTGPRI